jgi:hypothetical protein
MKGRIRLTCSECYREDFDGVDRIPDDWEDVDEFQSFEESITPVAIDDPHGDVTAWCTHLGLCPECQTLLYQREEGLKKCQSSEST